jgi:hypothetical protein
MNSGYLACSLLVEENDDLAIMLVNTIQKVKNEFIIFPFWKI